MTGVATMNRASRLAFTRRYRSFLESRKRLGLGKALVFLRQQAVGVLGQRQATVSLGRYTFGLGPSRPGSAPRSVSGRLARSVQIEVTKVPGGETVGRIGATAPYATALERGAYVPARVARRLALVMAVATRFGRGVIFRRRARAFRLHPRPWLAPLIQKHANSVSRILGESLSQ